MKENRCEFKTDFQKKIQLEYKQRMFEEREVLIPKIRQNLIDLKYTYLGLKDIRSKILYSLLGYTIKKITNKI